MARSLLARCVDTHRAYFILGNDTMELEHGILVGNADCMDLYDANCIVGVTAEGRAEVDELLAQVEVECEPLRHRCCKVDPLTPSTLEAQLALDDYEPTVELQMVLLGDLAETGPVVDIRPVTHELDWQSLRALMRVDHQERATRRQQQWPMGLTDQMWRQKQMKAPDVQFFIAHVEDRDCGYFSSWSGVAGVGMVEDLFVAPKLRNRGIGTALIAHCVDDARRRGAGIVTIGADIGDRPKRLYARLGFRPLALYRSYVKTL